MKRFLLACACLAAVLLRAAAAPEIAEVVVRNLGEGPMDASHVLAHTSLKAGEALDANAVARDVRTLNETELFNDVQVSVEPVGDKVRLVYAVRNRLTLVNPVRFEGNRRFGASKLRKWLDLYVGDAIGDRVVGARAAKLVEEYRKARYPDVTVTWEIITTDAVNGLADLVVRVNEGTRTHVKDMRFEGNHALARGELWKQYEERAWYNPFRWFSRRSYDRDQIESSRLRMLGLYLDRGYLDASVEVAGIQPDDRGRLTVHMKVEEGRLYHFGELAVTGVTLYPELEIRRQVAIRGDDPASVGAMNASAGAVRDFYTSRGYIDTRVRPATRVAADGRVNVTFEVTEGRLTRIRNIYVRGNAVTRDVVVRREITVEPGEVMNGVEVERSEKIVRNLGYFAAVRSRMLPVPSPDERDLLFEVEEQPTGQFMVGAGFSSIENLMGYVELSQRNFDLFNWPGLRGDGQKLKLRGSWSSNRRSYELSFTEPWFLERRLSLGFDLYNREYDYDDYDLERTGGAVSLGRAITRADRVSLQYRLERSLLSDFSDTNDYVYAESPDETYSFAREEDLTSSALRLTLTHDMRDQPFIPTRGNQSILFGEVAGGPLGFDTDIYNLGARSSQYVPTWFGQVLSLRARYEIVDSYGDSDDVPLGDRLFAGGGRTIRGYEYRDVGPKVISKDGGDYRPVGGQSLFVANIEYTFPIVNPLRFAVFYDLGNVWRDPFEFEGDDLATSAGAGLRFDIPGFPIRLDRAWAIQPDDELTEEDAWVFWIGFDN